MNRNAPRPAEAELRDFCRRWKITQLEYFGSAVRDDFRLDSDVDVMVSFAADAHWTLLDQQRLEADLAQLLGRSVDVVTRRAVERSANQTRRDEILLHLVQDLGAPPELEEVGSRRSQHGVAQPI